MTAGGRAGRRVDLKGCPAQEHVAWAVAHGVVGAPRPDVAELAQHAVVDDSLAGTGAEYLHRWTLGEDAIAEVTGWRTAPGGRVVVEYTSAGGRACELSWRVGADGRLEDRVHQRTDTDVEITGHRSDELDASVRAELHAVFRAAYADADGDHLDRQLAALGGVGVATDCAGRVVGFSLYGWQMLDLPVIGEHGVGLVGLSCVHPALRRQGIADATGVAAGMAIVEGPLHLGAAKLATPASLHWVLRSIPIGRWPSVDDPFALYDHPSSTQSAVIGALVAAYGGGGHEGAVCMGSGRPVGRPLVEPIVPSEEAAYFARVDRDRGDSLLWISWMTQPPDSWFV